MNKDELFYQRGMASMNLENRVAAVDDFDRAIQINPNHAEAHFQRGKCLKRRNKILAAIKSFGKAISADPNHAKAHLERGKCFEHMKKFSAAIKDFSKVIEIFPDPLADDFDEAILSAEAYYRRAGVYEELDDIPAAEEDHFQAMSNYVASMQFYMTAEEERELIFGNEPPPPEPPEDETIARNWRWFATMTLSHGKYSYDLDEFDGALKDFDSVIESLPALKKFFTLKVYKDENEILLEQLKKCFAGTFDKCRPAKFKTSRLLLATAYFWRGKCYEKLGDAAKAQDNFHKAKVYDFNSDLILI